MTDPTAKTAAVADAVARVISDAIEGYIFAAGVTQEVTDPVPYVVPIADDLSEQEMPIVTVAMGPWTSLLQPGNERLHMELLCAVWRERAELGQSVALLYTDRDVIADAFIAHSKAYEIHATIQAATFESGPGIVPRQLPNTARLFVTLPFTVRVVLNRSVIPQPA